MICFCFLTIMADMSQYTFLYYAQMSGIFEALFSGASAHARDSASGSIKTPRLS